jgi:hypothetical protein
MCIPCKKTKQNKTKQSKTKNKNKTRIKNKTKQKSKYKALKMVKVPHDTPRKNLSILIECF